MKLARTGVTTVLALAAAAAIAVLALTAISTTEAGTTIGLVAVDTDTTGNTATSLGTIQSCTEISGTGGTHQIDIVVDEIPPLPDGGVVGFQFNIDYDPAIVDVASVDVSQLLAAESGSSVIDLTKIGPDGDVPAGQTIVAAADFGSGDEDGPGILTRVIFDVVGTGTSQLTLSVVEISDVSQAAYTITTIQNGQLAVGESCTDAPTPTPTTGPTDSPTPTDAPTPTGTAAATPTGTAAATTAAPTGTAAASPGALPPTGGATSDDSGLNATLLLAAAAAALAAVGAGAFAMSTARRED